MTFNYDLTVKMILCVLTWYLKRYMINNVNFIKENIYANRLDRYGTLSATSTKNQPFTASAETRKSYGK